MVAAVQGGDSLWAVARTFQTSLCTVQRWVAWAGRRRLDRVDWADQPPLPHTVVRTAPEVAREKVPDTFQHVTAGFPRKRIYILRERRTPKGQPQGGGAAFHPAG